MADADFLLLDRGFQPLTERLAGWATCFDLARACLAGVAGTQTAILAWDLSREHSPLMLTLVAAMSLVQFTALPSVYRGVRRAERRARPGMMNIHRVTLRPIRLLWLCFSLLALPVWLASRHGFSDTLQLALTAFWLGGLYFESCTPAPPPARRASWEGLRFAPAAA